MYIIFESDAFRYICENPTLVPNEETKDKSSNIPSEKSTTDTQATSIDGTEEDPASVTSGGEPLPHYKAIQKYILYQKVRDVQYVLDDVQFIHRLKNKLELTTFSNFVNYVITFFDIFTYEEAYELSNHVLTAFKRLK